MEVAEVAAVRKQQYSPVKPSLLEGACQKWKVIFMPPLDPCEVCQKGNRKSQH